MIEAHLVLHTPSTPCQTIWSRTLFKLRFNGHIITFLPMKHRQFPPNSLAWSAYLPSHNKLKAQRDILRDSVCCWSFRVSHRHLILKPNLDLEPGFGLVYWFGMFFYFLFIRWRPREKGIELHGSRYLQQEPLIADDCGSVPVDDLWKRQLPAVAQHHRHTCSLRHTKREAFISESVIST